MVKFLLQRPIAVLMAFTACFIVGLVTYFSLPVSLLPDIAIPQITIQVTGENSSARELENTVVTPVRRQLLQVAGLREIKSETRDGAGVIRLEFDFGVNTDLAFIEVNEKIDAAMNSLPKEVTRPKAIKASATDIPVLYVNMTLKNDGAYLLIHLYKCQIGIHAKIKLQTDHTRPVTGFTFYLPQSGYLQQLPAHRGDHRILQLACR